MTKRLQLLLAVVAVLAVALTACSSSTASIETVPPQEAADELAVDSEAVLLDIRTPEEYAEARIPGAVNIDFYAADFADQLAQLDADGNYVVYCRSGNRSSQAMPIFEDLGFNSVTDVDGGIVAWYEAGLPVEG